ncbi:plasmid replication, integration and excision activator [Pseudonocardia broussonetiae]|uniref:Plasmid replication, integration and excision activator n=1 Tax=Pseudonocardia broussonetiae TaxID=2736640 RepID=A0A6M6JGU7_9PSEU|nr:plasmid replication, integration and excision activator [Pseudonocardia broussonetiae]QJY46270.1 plasmid replication, integration and excision activator [Pseudonocardia broussonetiae]
MAINGKFKVNHGDVFPHGAYVVGEVEPVRDFERSTRERPVQATDKETGQLVWSVSVLDPDPDARKDAKTVTVKIAAPHQPVPPEAIAGMPFRPVEFDGLTVTPYLNENGGRTRIAYSFRASAMRAPQQAGAGKPTPRAHTGEAA